MATQVIIWTAIPAGTSGGKLRVSVHMAPRLTDGSTLRDFPDFLDWPATLIDWGVKINGVIHPATVVGTHGESSLWPKLFIQTTTVAPYQYTNLTGRRFFTYPAAFVRSFLIDSYSRLAANSPTDHPTADYLLNNTAFGQLPRDSEEMLAAERSLLARFPKIGGPIKPGDKAIPRLDLAQASLFLRALTVPPPGATSRTVPHPPVPAFDFHQALSLLARHPALLRLFGIVTDLELARPAGAFPATVSVQAAPLWTSRLGAGSSDVLPETVTTWGTWLPAPRPAEPEISGGLLRLSDPGAYEVIEVDLDGASLKSLDFVQNVARASFSASSADTPTAFATPSLRSAGLSLARSQNATKLYGQLQNSGTLNNALAPGLTPPTLHAEDLTQGYRVDVWDSRRDAWFPLCRRIAAPHPGPGGYAIGKPPVIEPVPAGDEGWVELGLTSAGDNSSTDQYLPEPLLRWAGWSLVAPRPGKHLAADPHGGLESDQHNPATGAFPLRIDYAAAPGTLPLLRFGRSYRFRARAVDIGGNSVGFSASTSASAFKFASPPAFYGRLEPVPSPVLVPVARRTPGEHLERLVIRSNYNIPDSSPSIAPCARHVSPASTSEELAEQHGVLDDVHGRPDVAAYAEIAGRDGLSYASHTVIQRLGGKFDNQPMNAGQQWLYYPSDHLEVPYLPDAFARGVSFVGLPGSAGLVQAAFGSNQAWPASQSLRLVAEPGTGPVRITQGGNGTTLTVRLPKGTIARIRMSSHLHAADVDDMTLWSWLRKSQPNLNVAKAKAVIAEGLNWMFTPYRELVLVHAVKQPLKPPRLPLLGQNRDLGWTYCLLFGVLMAHPQTSQRVDVLAQWTEPYDDGRNPAGPVELHGTARVGELPLQPDSPDTRKLADLRHDFGDTKHRVVYYEAQATSRFLEYFTKNGSATLTGTSPVTVSPKGFAPGATTVRHGTVTYRAGVDYLLNDNHGTIARIAESQGGSIPDMQTVEVDYVVPPVTRSSLEPDAHPPTSKGIKVSIPSSARPAVPDVRYVIPAFEWLGSSSPAKIISARRGNVVRVYLGRPWWSSGEGERLGVVINNPPPGGIVPPPEPLPGLVTLYGPDPIVLSGPVKVKPLLADFPLADATAEKLFLAEQPHLRVDVAGHPVSYDTARALWFADIGVNAGTSYWPFVRLALVRYQPDSLLHAEISRVTQVDFAQLAPDRLATLTFPSPTSVAITVTGPGYIRSESTIGNQMRAWVQQSRPHVSDPELRWVQNPVDPGTLLLGKPGPDAVFVWRGTVALPTVRGSRPMRILIAETENYLARDQGDAPSRITYFDTIAI